ncbi:glycosyltransferase family 10 [Salegentibacter sp. F188]|uniref:Glycosyltransferase family 10 n=1 Tax=Autumnicola patrickiae TaxID=3075591 RepID=A0ABU3DY78_9FLAO|nr:glycosyltransferase family 10 [Salegentibacter sp. F188]MDT0688603.1 glycosyltransferase family 10 [Salegentibacter sp. F188]
MTSSPSLKINFADFWATFDKKNNLFYRILSEKYEVIISEDPDILFYSCYGWEYLKFNCIRIFYTAENKKLDFTAADFGISFEFLDRKNHYRFPFYAYRILSSNNLDKLCQKFTEQEAERQWEQKKRFCCMVVSNPGAKKRIEFFQNLNNLKKVDSGGGTLNNIGGRISNKLEFISKYKFVLAFENESFPGYLTEKLVDGILAGGIPVYWGDPLVGNVFNVERFIHYRPGENEEDIFATIFNMEKDKEKYMEILRKPVFRNNTIPDVLEIDNLSQFLFYCISESKNRKPVAKTAKKYLHQLNIKKRKLQKKLIFLNRRLNFLQKIKKNFIG